MPLSDDDDDDELAVNLGHSNVPESAAVSLAQQQPTEHDANSSAASDVSTLGPASIEAQQGSLLSTMIRTPAPAPT